jgi:threonyl-tRNA synthetase
MDLCKGPHLPSTKKVKAIKLMKVAGAYWKGKAENKQLQRIYGVAFPSEKDLKEYLRMLEEAEKRDHRKLGKQLELFSFHDEAPGFPFFLDKGLAVLNTLTNLWRKVHQKDGYLEIRTPLILNRKLWETSGHWENYRENMYTTKIDDEDYAIKPMNCPGGMLVYKEKVHSYRDFPLKIGEIGLVHRHELSGTLSGLFRVRAFTQDDAHIFMTEDQITEQILGVFKLVEDIYSLFNLEYHFELSTRPEKSIGSDEQWDFTTEALRKALELSGKRFLINEGDGAFYGPKVDIHIKDSIGRTWQCGTIQLDMSLPERFNLTYEGKDGKKHRPIMIHRVIYGSFERFFGILLEHYAGKLPLWLSPVQIKILTVADRFNDYAAKLKQEFENQGFRVELDTRSESIGKKVREAQLQKINYILVVGEKELNANTASVRTRENKVLGAMPVEKFIEKIKQEMTESSKGWF